MAIDSGIWSFMSTPSRGAPALALRLRFFSYQFFDPFENIAY